MQQSKQRRLSAEAWREMLERFEASGLSALGFCQQEGISVASLNRWRLRFRQEASSAPAKRTDVSAAKAATAEFVDLGALHSASSRVELRLDFGGGLVLQLSRS